MTAFTRILLKPYYMISNQKKERVVLVLVISAVIVFLVHLYIPPPLFLARIHFHYSDIAVRKWNRTLVSHTTTAGSLNDSYNALKFQVPNIVHYVWLGDDLSFTFIHYLSFLSVHRFINPSKLLVHGNRGPSGFWWERTKKEVSNIYLVKVDMPNTAPNGQPFKFKAHASDFIRALVLLEFGGIYIDADVLILKSFDPLRIYPTVMGRESSRALCNGIMVVSPQSLFMRLLLDQYYSYSYWSEPWGEKSVLAPDRMARSHPDLIHVEENSLNRPNFRETDKIFYRRYDWSHNYAMHLWIRKVSDDARPKTFSDVDCLNTTMGEMSRHILHGSSQIKC